MIRTDDTTVKMTNNDQDRRYNSQMTNNDQDRRYNSQMTNNDQERRYNDVQNTTQKTNFRMIMQNNPIIFY